MVTVINKKTGKRGIAIKANNEKILVQYENTKTWGLAKNFKFENGEQVVPKNITELENEFRSEAGAKISIEMKEKLGAISSIILNMFGEEELSWGEAHIILDIIRFFIAKEKGGYMPIIDVETTLSMNQIVFLSPENPYSGKIET